MEKDNVAEIKWGDFIIIKLKRDKIVYKIIWSIKFFNFFMFYVFVWVVNLLYPYFSIINK